jgi:hypothetical protein
MSLVPKFPPPFSYPNPTYSKSLGFWFHQRCATATSSAITRSLHHGAPRPVLCLHRAVHHLLLTRRTQACRVPPHRPTAHREPSLHPPPRHLHPARQPTHAQPQLRPLPRHSLVRQRLQPCHQPSNHHLQVCRPPPLVDWGPAHSLAIQRRAVHSITDKKSFLPTTSLPSSTPSSASPPSSALSTASP